MARKKQSIEDIIIESFAGSRNSGAFAEFSTEEFIGYVAGVVKLQNLNMDTSLREVLDEVRRLEAVGEFN